MNLSQDGFAASLGRFMRDQLHRNVSPSGNLIGMWERGEARPGQEYRAGLMAYTGLPEWELGLASPPQHTDSGTLEQSSDTSGEAYPEAARSVIATGMTLVGLGLGLRSDVPDRIGPEYAGELEEAVEAYRAQVYRRGASRQLQREVTDLLSRAAGSIAHARTSKVRVHVMNSAADAAGLAGYVCRDLGQHGLAQQHYLLAVQIARAAGDRGHVGHLVVRLAGHNIEMVRPADALAYLDLARRSDLADGFTHGELSNQHAIEAWACAQAGLTARAVRSAALAEAEAAREDHRNGPGWRTRHVAEAELYSLTGAGYAELARHEPVFADEAIRRLNRALELRGGESARNRTLDTISLAEAHLAAHDVAESARTAARAVGSARSSSSQRVRRRLGELRQRLAPYLDEAELATAFRLSRA